MGPKTTPSLIFQGGVSDTPPGVGRNWHPLEKRVNRKRWNKYNMGCIEVKERKWRESHWQYGYEDLQN